ncbi:oxidoreductase superfamily protein [Perilla frutescens var. hirtella]|uniref:Oxidoreductase superfamily protein n=1 Tax=Perilla frutescens var. hirtella TaxID=608512 RepID=A0AAD4JEC5_PERFH|nr:oxidoreductase superfamily protein [Perilla frutescens var. hirtella]
MVAPEIVLNSGHKMPALGFGTAAYPWPTTEQLTNTLVDAIAAGYRHLDTATMYGTEEAVGRAVAEAVERGLIKSRDEVFVTSKLFMKDAHRDLVLPAIKRTLRQLKFDYVDLYLVHWPIRMKQSVENHFNMRGEDMLHFDANEVWKAMEECSNLGLVNSIGVSNFSCAKLSNLLQFATIPPALNQVEMNVAWQQEKMVQFCKEKKIHVSAWSPLGANGEFWGSCDVMESPILKQIATSTNKTVAQVALRWIVEQGASPIVKSFDKERMKENLQVFNWELNVEDACKIRKNIPQERKFKGEIFVYGEGQYKSVEELWDGEI